MLLALAVALAVPFASAQKAAAPAAPAAPATAVAPVATQEAWSFGASAYAYFVPEDTDYVQPTFTADRGQLHLEARYNYENLDTGSAWIGANFSGGDRLTWEITPMLGGVFGATKGVAPGYKGALGWGMLALYSEGEYVFDSGGSADSFFYNWSELTLAPLEWLRFGLVTQRTRAYKSEREIQRGLLVGLTFKRWYVTGHVFNLDLDKPTTVLAVGLTF
jgi:hypothetical protein